MDLREFTELGSDIGRRVTDAINTGNYSQLNRDIKRKVEQAFTGSIYDSGLDGKLYKDPEETPPEGAWGQGNPNAGFDRVDPASYSQRKTAGVYRQGVVPVTSKPPKTGGPLAMMICGYAMTAVFGIACIGLALMMIPASAVDNFALGVTGAAAGLMVPFTAAGIVLAVAGTRQYGTAKRFRTYCNTLKNDSFCQIAAMASATGRDEKFTVKDLRKMIDKKFFPEGHLDDKETCFIGTNKTYEQYVQARDSAAKARARAEAEAQGFKAMPEDLQQVIREGEAYIKTIREANDAIPDEVISGKLYRMEDVVRKIFEYVRNNPDQIDQLRRFMSYYMPTTEKLVRAYQQMDRETILGDNMTRAKTEIAETLDTINEAYEKLYDSMHVEIAMDVASDISVLKTMFAQEGLTKDELKGGKQDE